MAKNLGLGKGLGALLDDNSYTYKPIDEAISTSAVSEIEISKIHANQNQPRVDFDPEAIEILAESIRQFGVIQPITLRKISDDNFEIIAGERRFRASQIAQKTTIPAYIRDVDDKQMLELALVENVHREDLNDIEVALSYRRLMDECGYTQEEVGNKIGRGRATIANMLRLLKLPEKIQLALRQKKVSQGQVRPLINVEDADLQLDLFNKVLEYQLSSRQVEELVKDPDAYTFETKQEGQGENPENQGDNNKTTMVKVNRPKLSDVQKQTKKQFTQKFNVPVDIKVDTKGETKLTFKLKNQEEYDRIIQLLNNIQL